MLVTAFVANENAGAIRLEVHDRKLFFGLRTLSELLVIPSESAVEWPAPSLEASIVPIAVQLSYLREYTVSKIVSQITHTSSAIRFKGVSKEVIKWLVTRGLLEWIEDKDFFVDNFGPQHISTPSSTLDLVSRAPVSRISEMVSDFERRQPDLWGRLFKEASSGVLQYAESRESDGD